MIVYPNAKINIGLNVTERRPDNYHNIETVFYPAGLHDVLTVKPLESCEDYSLSLSGIDVGGDTENNLVVKAYRLLRTHFELPAVDISLHKQIPSGAGLGGGSSDAAFMLKALNELFDLKITQERLTRLASQLGADCPFFIHNIPVFATGTGNIFTSVELSLKGYGLLLVKPDINISTPEAYACLTPALPEMPLTELIKRPMGEWKYCIRNDFEKYVFRKYPVVEQLKEKMYELGAVYASMSGSGSSVYGIFDQEPLYEGLFANYFVAYGILS